MKDYPENTTFYLNRVTRAKRIEGKMQVVEGCFTLELADPPPDVLERFAPDDPALADFWAIYYPPSGHHWTADYLRDIP